MNHNFKPFDRVLVRDADDDVWRIQFYSHPYGELHACLNGVHIQCIPYEGNEELLGTTDGLEPKLKEGDVVLVWNKGDTTRKIRVYSNFDSDFYKHVAFDTLLKDWATTEGQMWDHAEKFVPATVES